MLDFFKRFFRGSDDVDTNYRIWMKAVNSIRDEYMRNLLFADIEYATKFLPVVGRILSGHLSITDKKQALNDLKEEVLAKGESCEIDGMKLYRYPFVFNPAMAGSTRTMIKALDKWYAGKSIEERHKLTVFEVGIGSGALSIAIAKRGVGKLVGLDTNPLSIACAQLNCEVNNVDFSLMDFRSSDIFSAVEKGRKAQLIIGALPFDTTVSRKTLSSVPRLPGHKLMVSAYCDVELQSNNQFISEAFEYLSEGGSVIQNFSDLADTNAFRTKLKQVGWQIDLTVESDKAAHNFYAYILKKRDTQGPSEEDSDPQVPQYPLKRRKELLSLISASRVPVSAVLAESAPSTRKFGIFSFSR